MTPEDKSSIVLEAMGALCEVNVEIMTSCGEVLGSVSAMARLRSTHIDLEHPVSITVHSSGVITQIRATTLAGSMKQSTLSTLIDIAKGDTVTVRSK